MPACKWRNFEDGAQALLVNTSKKGGSAWWQSTEAYSDFERGTTSRYVATTS